MDDRDAQGGRLPRGDAEARRGRRRKPVLIRVPSMRLPGASTRAVNKVAQAGWRRAQRSHLSDGRSRQTVHVTIRHAEFAFLSG